MNDRDTHDFIQAHPHPGTDPVARLRHTLDIYDTAEDERIVVQATNGMYGPGDVTGLTFGDLRAIARLIGA